MEGGYPILFLKDPTDISSILISFMSYSKIVWYLGESDPKKAKLSWYSWGWFGHASFQPCSCLKLCSCSRCCSLTHSWQEIFLQSVVWTYGTFESNFEINHKFIKYLKERCGLNSGQYSFFRYFLEDAFIREILQRLWGGFGRGSGHLLAPKPLKTTPQDTQLFLWGIF